MLNKSESSALENDLKSLAARAGAITSTPNSARMIERAGDLHGASKSEVNDFLQRLREQMSRNKLISPDKKTEADGIIVQLRDILLGSPVRVRDASALDGLGDKPALVKSDMGVQPAKETKRLIVGGRVIDLPVELLNLLGVIEGQKIDLTDLSDKGTSVIHRDEYGVRGIDGISTDFLYLMLKQTTDKVRYGNLWYFGWVDGANKAKIVIMTNQQYQFLFLKSS